MSLLEQTETRSEQAAVTTVRPPSLAERIVFVGGHPGCGKTMMGPIVGSLARVEVMKFNFVIEYLCALRLLEKIDVDAVTTVIRLVTDVDLYNLMMSREVNCRFSDLSSVFRNPGTLRYLHRLFQPGDAAAVTRIAQEHPILHYASHNVLALSPPLFLALGDRIRMVVVVRHPLYLLKQWHLYINRYGTDVREFTLWLAYQGQALPFFAHGWEERYLQSNSMDRVIYSIEQLDLMGERAMQSLPERQRAQIMIVPFERFVRDPWPCLGQLETMLGSQVTARTRRELKRQRVPRKRLADGIDLKIYRANGWEPARRDAAERDELKRRRDFAAQHATPAAMAVLDRLCAGYEAKYLDANLLG